MTGILTGPTCVWVFVFWEQTPLIVAQFYAGFVYKQKENLRFLVGFRRLLNLSQFMNL